VSDLTLCVLVTFYCNVLTVTFPIWLPVQFKLQAPCWSWTPFHILLGPDCDIHMNLTDSYSLKNAYSTFQQIYAFCTVHFNIIIQNIYKKMHLFQINILIFNCSVSSACLEASSWRWTLGFEACKRHKDFNVHGSVQRESMWIIVQRDATIYSLLHFSKLLYVFRVVTPSIIRSTYNCNHSIWHWSNRLCYLPLSWSSSAPDDG